MTEKGDRWSVKHSAELYRLSQWGDGCFNISPEGEILVNLNSDGKSDSVSLCQIKEEMQRRDIRLPLIIHFPQILDRRIRRFVDSFAASVRKFGYRGQHRGCFPIKVNQKRGLAKRILTRGASHHFGLEVGTKAELIEAMSLIKDPDACLICNGYKDAEYIHLALTADQAGLDVRIVLERPSEIPLVIREATQLGATPRLGIRVRLSNRSAGRWAESSGDTGMFGFRLPELVTAVEELKRTGHLDWLRMLHFHQGSQIPELGAIERGLIEACHHYRHLIQEGAPLEAIDIGGGLAVDYEGAQSNSHGSREYSLEGYCDTVVGVIHKQLSPHLDTPPDIITESGRAIASHGTVLLFEILEHTVPEAKQSSDSSDSPPSFPTLEELRDLKPLIHSESKDELWQRIEDLCEETSCAYSNSQIDLRQYSRFYREKEELKRKIDREAEAAPADAGAPKSKAVAEYYYGNFSVFQSLPDAWGIKQPFPILPIQRLDETPSENGVICDITCDCDGAIRKYFSEGPSEETLPLHKIRPGESYCLAAFLIGSYQESLGHIHNLFGAPAAVSVILEEGELMIQKFNDAQTIASVLSQVDFSQSHLFDGFTDLVDDALDSGRITSGQRGEMIRYFGSRLDSPTYLRSAAETTPAPTAHESDQRIHRSSFSTL